MRSVVLNIYKFIKWRPRRITISLFKRHDGPVEGDTGIEPV